MVRGGSLMSVAGSAHLRLRVWRWLPVRPSRSLPPRDALFSLVWHPLISSSVSRQVEPTNANLLRLIDALGLQ
jgi:hypothetical protein